MTPLSDALTAAQVLRELSDATIVSALGTTLSRHPDEVYDFRIVTDKGALLAYATNNGGIALEWRPSP